MASALTTTFTQPPDCLTTTPVHITWTTGCRYGGTECPYVIEGPRLPEQPSCFPSGFNPTTTAYFSPGLCPSGYTPACTELNSAATITETVYTCCPELVCHVINRMSSRALTFLQFRIILLLPFDWNLSHTILAINPCLLLSTSLFKYNGAGCSHK